MGITNLINTNGIDWSEYSNFPYSFSQKNADIGEEYITVLEIKGEGFLLNALAGADHGMGATSDVYSCKLTIDGKVVTEYSIGSASNDYTTYLYGVYYFPAIYGSGSKGYLKGNSSLVSTGIDRLPKIDTTSTTRAPLFVPLFFKKSVKFEVKKTATNNGSFYLKFEGGLKK